MKKQVCLIAGAALMVLSSCSVTQQTASTLESEAAVRNFTVADLDVSPNRVTSTLQPDKATRRAGEQNVKRAVESKALKENGNGDVLVDPEFIIKRKGVSKKISEITVSGHPAKFKNYRSLNDSVWSNPAFRGIPTIKVQKAAQRVNANAGFNFEKEFTKAEPVRKRGYNRISLMYAPVFSSAQVDGTTMSDNTAHGFGVSYIRGISLSRKLPLYIEAGVTWQFAPESCNHDEYEPDGGYYTGWTYVPPTWGSGGYDHKMMRVSVPLMLTYRFAFGSDGAFKLSPFTGVNFGFNVLNEFSEGDYGGSENTFQAGWLIGANFTYRNFNVGLTYCLDGGAAAENGDNCKLKTSNLQVSLGWEF